jgi:hypothetical protein
VLLRLRRKGEPVLEVEVEVEVDKLISDEPESNKYQPRAEGRAK